MYLVLLAVTYIVIPPTTWLYFPFNNGFPDVRDRSCSNQWIELVTCNLPETLKFRQEGFI